MKYPYEILLENAPYSSELEFQMWQIDVVDDPQMIWWKEKSFSQVIAEVQEIADRYSIDSGWSHGEEIAMGNKNAKKELKELKAVLKHMKKVYKEVV
tara:strand:- start:739 stop:1029 length:291 start_codon:yes stop_codon:yes gene_type:complete